MERTDQSCFFTFDKNKKVTQHFLKYNFKVHLDPPPILVQSSQKLQDNGTKKVKIYFWGKNCLFTSFLGFWSVSISQP